MFEAIRVLQVLLWAAVVALGAWRLRAIHVGAVDGVSLARRLRGRSRELFERALLGAGPHFGVLHRAAITGDDDAEVTLRESVLEAERAVTRGVSWLRIVGLLASAVGFVAVAHQISWLHEDHGLLDLDAGRVGRMASERSAVALALAVAASGTGVAISSVLRAGVRARLAGIRALAAAIERLRGGETRDEPARG